jgi:hypothetical protein
LLLALLVRGPTTVETLLVKVLPHTCLTPLTDLLTTLTTTTLLIILLREGREAITTARPIPKSLPPLSELSKVAPRKGTGILEGVVPKHQLVNAKVKGLPVSDFMNDTSLLSRERRRKSG